MNHDDIIRMAEEAGLCRDDEVWFSHGDVDADVTTDDLKRFAALIAAAEREACARMCEAYMAEGIGREMARAIRARGEG